MLQFDLEHTNELELFLNQCSIHDGFFEKVLYDYNKKSVSIKIENPIWNAAFDITFLDTVFFTAISDDCWGNNETIMGLTVDKDLSEMKSYCKDSSTLETDCLHYMFEMFSGNRIHICCKVLQIAKHQIDEKLFP